MCAMCVGFEFFVGGLFYFFSALACRVGSLSIVVRKCSFKIKKFQVSTVTIGFQLTAECEKTKNNPLRFGCMKFLSNRYPNTFTF